MTEYSGKIIFAGGGTGGHVYPALASIEILKTRGNFDILYVGGYNGIETKIVPALGLAFKKLWISGFQRYFTLKNFIIPLKLLISLLQSILLLIKLKPKVVIGTGGYVSGPVLYSAAVLGIPTLIQEQDNYPGITTKILAKYVDVICLSFAEASKYLKKVKGKIVVTGNPVRKSIETIDREIAVKYWGLDSRRPIIFVFGGSQGAQSINRAISQIAPQLMETYSIQFLWQTGEKNFKDVSILVISKEPDVKIIPYIETITMAYSAADIIVSRAGALTLAELAMVGKASILIPYPFAAGDHQTKNAQAIEASGAAIVVKEDNNFHSNLKEAMTSLLIDTQLTVQMGRNWNKIYKPDAADKIVDQILKIFPNDYSKPDRKN
jgi:UDP-N-acetylglucosamine--N-acetylmuramyl-(pentapeptide) pyrophosphoryl-undecaprenol N-acetylglucosamine transferase